MATDEFDLEEIDRLVEGLAKPLKVTPPTAPFAPLVDGAAPAQTTDQGTLTPGQRWTTATLLMPAARTEPRKPFKIPFPAFLKFPAFPKFAAFPALPGIPPGALSARLFVGLGVLLSAAMPYWPYAHGWSWGLVVYLAAVALNLITGIWGAKLTWDERLPAAHTIAVGIVLWGVGLLAAETVPRLPYV